MTRTRRIEISHDGTRLLGTAIVEPRDIAVHMVEPFPTVHATRHFPRFPAGHPDGGGYLRPDGDLTPFARLTAEHLLVGLFDRETRIAELRKLLAPHAAELRAMVVAGRREVELASAPDSPIDDTTFHGLRAALRRDLRAGLDPHVYELRHHGLAKRRQAGHHRHDVLHERVIVQVAERFGVEPSRALLSALAALDVGPLCQTHAGFTPGAAEPPGPPAVSPARRAWSRR